MSFGVFEPDVRGVHAAGYGNSPRPSRPCVDRLGVSHVAARPALATCAFPSGE